MKNEQKHHHIPFLESLVRSIVFNCVDALDTSGTFYIRQLCVDTFIDEYLEELKEKQNCADQAWRQESVPSKEDVKMEQEEDEIADNRDAEQQELDAIERPAAQTKVEKEIRR